jgi:copper chaperone CopZ
MKSVTLKIEGMRCDGCARAIETLVEREAGVKTVTVAFEGGEARILYDPGVVTAGRLAAAVEERGYRVVAREP